MINSLELRLQSMVLGLSGLLLLTTTLPLTLGLRSPFGHREKKEMQDSTDY